MAETIKICKHNTNGIGYCDILGGYCVEGPCSHEELAEYAPVRNGRWEKRKDDYYGLNIIKCSVCSEEWFFEVDADVIELNYHYCPNCGAKMESDGE